MEDQLAKRGASWQQMVEHYHAMTDLTMSRVLL